MIAEQSKTAEYSTIGRGIAAALGRAWRFDPSDLTHIQGPRGRALRLQWEGWNNRGRVEVSGEYPPCPPEVGCSSSYVNKHGGDEWPSGTFAMSRGAEMIGRDVANRILPGYARLYPIIEGRIAAAMAEHRACVGPYRDNISREERS